LSAQKHQQISQPAKAAVIKSRQQPLWHVVLLNILTICGYSVLWFYKNWKQLSEFAKKEYAQTPDPQATIRGSPESWKYFANMRPWIHTFGVIVPFLQFYFFFLGFKQFAEVSPKCKTSPYLMGILLTACYASLLPFAGRLDLWALVSFLSTGPLVYSQYLFNAFWQSVESPQARVRQTFSVEEWLFIIFGIFIMILYLILLILGPFILKFMGESMKHVMG
jgi:hypothetical protein